MSFFSSLSGRLGAALRAELRSWLELGATLGALALRKQGGSALGAELAPLILDSARRADDHGGGFEIESLREVLLAQLLPGLVNGDLGLEGTDLPLGHRGAADTESALGVPADLVTHPLAAAFALDELGTDLGHRFSEGGIMAGTLDQILESFGAVGSAAQEAAEHAACSAEQPGGHAGLAGLPRGHVSVAAALAYEFELITALGGEVLIVVGEFDRSHGYPPQESDRRRADTGNLAAGAGASQGRPRAAGRNRSRRAPGGGRII